ncbi:GTP cyclohydrolase I [Verrucomicrobium sp. GAS474]|uniref:GTP cyclohydrolase FolE2 n=1 Tax=Verrucomicrobium sp. GAS474 TaxID=1882831 RepID=UPI00087D1819|nr:GTP cyclohydrolase FolE2 [Verrucomicrobium sp. GAS474]SDT99678.1 GTP cyclohydrolase I [Verrucomicrobium sp. GAS474]
MTASAASIPDRQGERDTRNIPIDRVGVKGLRYPIEVKDRAHATQSTVATFAMTVDLPHQFKGTHMSRFVEILNAHGRLIHVENVEKMLRALQKRLHAERAHIEMEFPYFIGKKAPATGAVGLVDYVVKFETTVDGPKRDFVLTVIVPVTTLCPCSKAISAYGAHNQRGYVSLAVRFEKTVWIEELIALIEASASSEIFSLLKRPDEKAVTERAYDNPVFVEDLVRNVALRVNAHPQVTWYKVEAENMESIHNHAAYALIEKRKDAPKRKPAAKKAALKKAAMKRK